jgi:copper chaperone CopZ
MIIETMITLSRLNCSGCVRNVTNALQVLSGVEIMKTDIPARNVYLRYFDDQITLEQIKAVLAEARYPVVSEQLVTHISM